MATLFLGQRRYRHHQVPGTLHQGGGDIQPLQQGVLRCGDPGKGRLVLGENFQQVLPPLMPGEALYFYSHCLMFFVDHNSLFRRLGPRLLSQLPRQLRHVRVLLFTARWAVLLLRQAGYSYNYNFYSGSFCSRLPQPGPRHPRVSTSSPTQLLFFVKSSWDLCSCCYPRIIFK